MIQLKHVTQSSLFKRLVPGILVIIVACSIGLGPAQAFSNSPHAVEEGLTKHSTGKPAPNLQPITLEIVGPGSVSPGETFSASVVAHDVTGDELYGVQFEINYDPSLVLVGNLQVNSDLSFVARNNADNSSGKIILVASQQGEPSGLTGDVTLLAFEATAAQSPGKVIFSFANEKLSNSDAQSLEFTSQDLIVLIEEVVTPDPTDEPTPEPTDEPTSTPDPTDEPTPEPTDEPISTPDPTDEPTPEPTDEPISTPDPTDEPTPEPTDEPISTPDPTDEPTPEPTDEPTSTPDPTDEPTPEPTDEPILAAVFGQVILAGRTNNDWSGAVVVVNDKGNRQSGATDTNGNFNILDVAPGVYESITVDVQGYLSAVCNQPSVSTPETALTTIALLSGDINDDNLIDIADATAVGAGFGQTGEDLVADINHDHILDIFDIVLVSVNHGKAGPQDWDCVDGTQQSSNIVWSVDHETGNLSQWDGESNSNGADSEITSDFAHSGQYSAAAHTTGSHNSGTRLELRGRWDEANRYNPENLPNEAYYSAWYFIPNFIGGYNNIFQWKQSEKTSPDTHTRRKVFSITINDMVPYLNSKITEDGQYTTNSKNIASFASQLPIGQWFQLECFYRWSTEPDGKVICWLDGEEMFRVENLRTQFVDMEWLVFPREWTVNNYTVGSDQPPHTIYIDDAMISKTRVGPGF